MKIAEVAAELEVSRQTVHRLIRLELLRATRPGLRDLRVSREAFEAYKARTRVRPAPIVKRGGRVTKGGDVMAIAKAMVLREVRR